MLHPAEAAHDVWQAWRDHYPAVMWSVAGLSLGLYVVAVVLDVRRERNEGPIGALALPLFGGALLGMRLAITREMEAAPAIAAAVLLSAVWACRGCVGMYGRALEGTPLDGRTGVRWMIAALVLMTAFTAPLLIG